MHLDSDQRRVLIAATSSSCDMLRRAFTFSPLDYWQVLEADSFSRARFVLQHNPCDVLLVNDDLYEREGGQGLLWLAWQQQTPVVFMSDSGPNLQKAYDVGVSVCVPRQMALDHPPLLATALEQAVRAGMLRNASQRMCERLAASRRHVDRLVNMMWRTSTRMADGRWLSQRAMLDRLGEELARVERHQIPLSVAVGEVQPAYDVEPSFVADGAMGQTIVVPSTTSHSNGEPFALPDWAMDVLAAGKRRSDVIGQYGPGGFMLMMMHTPAQGGIECCRRLQIAIEHVKEPLPGPHTGLHAYFGIASAAGGKMSAAALLRAAEQNLESARVDNRVRLAADTCV